MTALLSKFCLLAMAAALAMSSKTIGERFVTSTPCNDAIRKLHNIPAGADCSAIKWDLLLSTENGKQQFSMRSEWGFYINNWTLEKRGETSATGTWSAKKSDGIETVRLVTDNGISVSFRRLDANHLHLLDNNKLAVGHDGYSYTLNKSEAYKTETSKVILRTATFKENFNRLTFIGRTPCQEIAREAGISVDAACFKLKWKLTLYQDSLTHLPTAYEMSRIQYRLTPLKGTWKIMSATINGRTETFYQLDPDKPEMSVTLLKGDENVLFFVDRNLNLLPGGNEFGYTLNRK